MHIFKIVNSLLMLFVVFETKTSEKPPVGGGDQCNVKRRYRHEVYATTAEGQKCFILTREEVQEKRKEAQKELKRAEEKKLRSKVELFEQEHAESIESLKNEEQAELKRLQQEAMLGCVKVVRSQESVDSLRLNLRDFYSGDSKLRNAKKTEMLDLLMFIMPSMLNQIDPATGQAVGHLLTPLHWDLDLLERMRLSGVDFSIQTQLPDRFPGATIGHNVAAILAKKRQKIKEGFCDDYEAQKLEYQIVNAQGCLAWLMVHYPGIENSISFYRTLPEMMTKQDWKKISQKKEQMINQWNRYQ